MKLTSKTISQWQLSINRNVSFLHQWLSSTGNHSGIKLFGFKTSLDTFSINKGFEGFIYYHKKSIESLSQELRALAQNPERLQKLTTTYHALGNNLLLRAKHLSQVKVDDKTELQSTLKAYLNAYNNYTAGLNISALAGHLLTNDLYMLLQAERGEAYAQVGKLISILTFPNEPTPAQAEEFNLLQLAAKSRKLNPTSIVSGLKKHHERYRVIPANFIGSEWTLAYFKTRLRLYSRSAPAKKLKRLLAQRQKQITERDALLRKLTLSREAKNLVVALRTIATLNEYRKFVFSRACVLPRPLFKALAKSSGLVGWEPIQHLTTDEVYQLAARKQVSKIKQQYSRRQGHYSGVIYDQGVRELSSAEITVVRSTMPPFVKTATQNVNEVRGFIGNRGIVRGRVRLVLTPADFSRVRKGDIIIARMTSADYIAVMRLASAFVTDEGGITSHAAIVSREMRKPCIIGTKIATHLFKDGDRVEVDATKGVVRKL